MHTRWHHRSFLSTISSLSCALPLSHNPLKRVYRSLFQQSPPANKSARPPTYCALPSLQSLDSHPALQSSYSWSSNLLPWTLHAAAIEGSTSVAAAKDSLTSNAPVLQALLQITQGIILGWMFGVAAQEARVVAAIERGLLPIMVRFDVELDDSHPIISYDESDEDEDK